MAPTILLLLLALAPYLTPVADRNHTALAAEYTGEVVSGRVPACKWVQLACQRQIDNLARAKRGWDYRWDEEAANRVCRFIELLPHTKGDWAAKRQSIVLEPWQCFVQTTIYGWKRISDGYRRYRIAYVCVPRKNGKSIFAGGTGNYMFAADGEYGAEVYSGATSEKQAWEVFRPAKQMIERTPKLKDRLGIYVGAKNMAVLSNGSRFEPVIGKPGDGASPSCGIVDEYHEHDSDELFDTLRTGMGARKQPLMLIITTAGTNLGGPCYNLQIDVQKVLSGGIEREELFGAIYGIDPDDDWTSEEALKKANPNYDVSVFGDFLRTEQRNAIQNAAKQNVFKTKHLNIWCGASSAWLNMELWNKLGDPSLNEEAFRGEHCCAALDVSSKLDITARIKIFKRRVNGLDHFYVFPTLYLPETIVQDPAKQQYQGWAHKGWIKTTSGNVIDYDTIEADMIDDCNRFKIAELGYDPWNAEQLTQHVAAKTPTTRVEVRQTVQAMSEPMKQVEAMVIAGRLHHNANPCMTWMMSNVVAHRDVKENIYPRKEREENKIDGAVALIMALSRSLVADGGGSVYSTRGLLTL